MPRVSDLLDRFRPAGAPGPAAGAGGPGPRARPGGAVRMGRRREPTRPGAAVRGPAVSAGWVAGAVRARALGRRRMGFAGARQLAACRSLPAALELLAASP